MTTLESHYYCMFMRLFVYILQGRCERGNIKTKYSFFKTLPSHKVRGDCCVLYNWSLISDGDICCTKSVILNKAKMICRTKAGQIIKFARECWLLALLANLIKTCQYNCYKSGRSLELFGDVYFISRFTVWSHHTRHRQINM